MKHDKAFIQKKVAELLAIDLTNKKLSVESTSDVNNGTLDFQKLILRLEGEIPLPVLQLKSKSTRSNKIIIWLNEKGKAELADSTSLMQSYADQNDAVFLCDVSGTGETTDNPEFNDKIYYNKEYRNAMLELHIGMPMVGIRT